MLLDETLKRNPEMIAAAIELHQEGAIPPGSQLIDLDAVAHNGALIADVAEENELRVMMMTKQNGHNPHMTRVLLNQGLHNLCAVEALQAHRINRYGFPIGHVGHLAQVPKHQVKQVIEMKPEFVTVYNLEAARRVSDAAGELGIHQNVYVRVFDPEDGRHQFESTVGGWEPGQLVDGVRPLLDLPNITVAGLTQHCVVDYTIERDPRKAKPSPSFFTMLRGKELLEKELGLEELRMNCAGNTNTVTMPLLASYGATDVEPGMALAACAPFHAWQELPEKPAQVTVSEVMHHWEGELVGIGGIFNYVWDPPNHDLGAVVALVGSTFDEATRQRATFRTRGDIDYHGVFGPPGVGGKVGDSMVISHHPQAHNERGYTIGVSGISHGDPKVTGLFDGAVNPVDSSFQPISMDEALRTLDEVGDLYPARTPASH